MAHVALWGERDERNPRDARPKPSAPAPRYVLGLDLGQTHDYSALALDEVQQRTGFTSHDIRHLQRWPLRTPYPQIVADVAALTRRAPLKDTDTLVIDQTGVGRPVVDMFRQASLGVQMVPVTITGGLEVTSAAGEYRVPKRELVSVVTVLLQDARLHIAKNLREASTLTTELSTFQAKITLAATDVYGTWREGTNDDTVLAVALAAWFAEQHSPGGVWFI